MVKGKRQLYMLDKLEKEGRILTNEMVQEFGLAEDTIRKDFQELCAQNKAKRFHGGIMRVKNEAIDFKKRLGQQPEIKHKLALKAVQLVENKSVLFIDGGTTNLEFAKNLPLDFTGTIITNSPEIALALCSHQNIEIVLLGGVLNKVTKVITGSMALDQIKEMNIECCILGVSSLTPENGITFPLADEAMLKKEIVRHSKQVIAIANKEKLGSIAPFKAIDISDVDTLVVNETDEEVLKDYRAKNIKLIILEDSNS